MLDIGGGPGHYTCRLAELGCDVTLLDLSPENVCFAKPIAGEHNLFLSALKGDASNADTIVKGHFDHVLLMSSWFIDKQSANGCKP